MLFKKDYIRFIISINNDSSIEWSNEVSNEIKEEILSTFNIDKVVTSFEEIDSWANNRTKAKPTSLDISIKYNIKTNDIKIKMLMLNYERDRSNKYRDIDNFIKYYVNSNKNVGQTMINDLTAVVTFNPAAQKEESEISIAKQVEINDKRTRKIVKNDYSTDDIEFEKDDIHTSETPLEVETIKPKKLSLSKPDKKEDKHE